MAFSHLIFFSFLSEIAMLVKNHREKEILQKRRGYDLRVNPITQVSVSHLFYHIAHLHYSICHLHTEDQWDLRE